jgi:Uri superfamily endonuclease
MLPESLPRDPGSYLLILRSHSEQNLPVGKAGNMHVMPGFYLYTGSAFGPGGLRARAGRHLRGGSNVRWHIDYLRQVTEAWAVWFYTGSDRMEHQWANSLERLPQLSSPMKNIGSSDCACATHLFFSQTAPSLKHFKQQLKLDGLSASLNELVCPQ